MGKLHTAEENLGWITDKLKSLTPRCTGAINSAFSPFVNGARYMAETPAEKRSFKDFAENAWGGEGLTSFNVGDMRLNGAEMAKTAAGLGIGYRALSGDGAYRDKNGNTDIAGIPFV